MVWLETLSQVFDTVRPGLGGALCIAGALMALIGTIGVLRFPDYYTRTHAAGVTDTAGATLLILGMLLLSPHWLILVKLFTVWLLLFMTGPTASHAVANAAYTAGIEPMTGKRARGETDEDHL
ncbi:MAG: monovalent cation/H(+) antiporter subunit G [Hyphomonadaceae bacterium]